MTLGVLLKGIKKGIEAANKIFLPTLIVLFLIIVIRAVTLDGAMEGLHAFLNQTGAQLEMERFGLQHMVKFSLVYLLVLLL